VNRLLAAILLASAFAATAAARGPDVRELKVRVHVNPDQLGPLARQVLEFYEVTPSSFVGAVAEDTYDELVRAGYRVDVLVADVRALALERCPEGDFGEFHTYQEIQDTWATVAQNNPGICRLDTIGVSANGYRLIAMRVTDNPDSWEPEPRLCFDGMTHGNENNGTEIVHEAMVELVSRYGTDPDITRWVDNRDIWLIPFVNPDGLISRSRYNGHDVDLNRNYGYSWDEGGPSVFSETEVQALFHLGRKYPMDAWTQYHSGAEAAMWPWGYTDKATRDSVVHDYEMTRYGQICSYDAYQISRGLYPVNGGCTDWYYGATGALAYGVEVCYGQPSEPSEIDTISHKNWTAMKEMIERVMWGISGRVTDSTTGQPLVARVTVDPPDWLTYSDSAGYFHKTVDAGTCAVTASANGYAPRTVSGVVVPADTLAWVDIALAPDTAAPATAFWVLTNRIAESPTNTNTTNGWWALGERDGRFFSIGRGGWASFDIGERTPIINGPGSDFFVVEGDDGAAEACSVYVANDWNGPWHYVGFGTGTQAYDLSAASQSVAQFVRIADDNVGGGTGQYAGFDIDAIEAVVVNAPALVYQGMTVVDSPPGGNNDGKLDPGEAADLFVAVKNVGRVGVSDVTAVLRTGDSLVSVADSTGTFGDLEPDSLRVNDADRFVVTAAANTPREHVAEMMMYLVGTDYEDSIEFTLVVGELRVVDPIPDGPRQPARYWAYDDVDTGYAQAPEFGWVEVRGVGTRLDLSDDETETVNLPSGFGPWRYYGQSYSQVSVCGNGFVAPGYETYTYWGNSGLPAADAPGMVALCWDDLYPPTGGGVWYYHDAANHRFVVEWDSVAYVTPRSQRDKFELLLYDTTVVSPTGDNVVEVQYLTANNYGSSTVGLQDPTVSVAIQCLYNGSYHRGAAALAGGRAIRYTTTDPTGIAEPRPGPVPAAGTVRVLPNPSRGRVALSVRLERPGPARVQVFDATGRLVRTLLDSGARALAAGSYALAWDGLDQGGHGTARGVFLVRLCSAGGTTAEKLVRVE